MQDYLDVLRQVLDHEVVDANNVPCGMVDDIEMECSPGKQLRVTALLIGPGAWADRLPRMVGKLAAKVFGRHTTRVPWSEISVITERIKLKTRASELGLGKADRKAGKWISKLPLS